MLWTFVFLSSGIFNYPIVTSCFGELGPAFYIVEHKNTEKCGIILILIETDLQEV